MDTERCSNGDETEEFETDLEDTDGREGASTATSTSVATQLDLLAQAKLPPGWELIIDDEAGEFFYFNRDIGVSQLERPEKERKRNRSRRRRRLKEDSTVCPDQAAASLVDSGGALDAASLASAAPCADVAAASGNDKSNILATASVDAISPLASESIASATVAVGLDTNVNGIVGAAGGGQSPEKNIDDEQVANASNVAKVAGLRLPDEAAHDIGDQVDGRSRPLVGMEALAALLEEESEEGEAEGSNPVGDDGMGDGQDCDKQEGRAAREDARDTGAETAPAGDAKAAGENPKPPEDCIDLTCDDEEPADAKTGAPTKQTQLEATGASQSKTNKASSATAKKAVVTEISVGSSVPGQPLRPKVEVFQVEAPLAAAASLGAAPTGGSSVIEDSGISKVPRPHHAGAVAQVALSSGASVLGGGGNSLMLGDMGNASMLDDVDNGQGVGAQGHGDSSDEEHSQAEEEDHNASALLLGASSMAGVSRGICKWYAAGFCRKPTECARGVHDSDVVRKTEALWVGSPVATSSTPPRPMLLVLELGASKSDEMIEDREHAGCSDVLEFAVIALCSMSGRELGRFHRFVQPQAWKQGESTMRQRYGGTCFNSRSNAVMFQHVVSDVVRWVCELLGVPETRLQQEEFLFVTFGNFAMQVALPLQCSSSLNGAAERRLQQLLFSRWCNVKEVFREVNGLSRSHKISGLRSMLRQLSLSFAGQRDLGMDSTMNLANVVRSLLASGAHFAPTRVLTEPPSVMSKAAQPHLALLPPPPPPEGGNSIAEEAGFSVKAHGASRKAAGASLQAVGTLPKFMAHPQLVSPPQKKDDPLAPWDRSKRPLYPDITARSAIGFGLVTSPNKLHRNDSFPSRRYDELSPTQPVHGAAIAKQQGAPAAFDSQTNFQGGVSVQPWTTQQTQADTKLVPWRAAQLSLDNPSASFSALQPEVPRPVATPASTSMSSAGGGPQSQFGLQGAHASAHLQATPPADAISRASPSADSVIQRSPGSIDHAAEAETLLDALAALPLDSEALKLAESADKADEEAAEPMATESQSDDSYDAFATLPTVRSSSGADGAASKIVEDAQVGHEDGTEALLDALATLISASEDIADSGEDMDDGD